MIFNYPNKLLEQQHHKQSKDKQLVETRIMMLSKGEERSNTSWAWNREHWIWKETGCLCKVCGRNMQNLELLISLQKENPAPCALCFLRAWKTRLWARETYLCYWRVEEQYAWHQARTEGTETKLVQQ